MSKPRSKPSVTVTLPKPAPTTCYADIKNGDFFFVDNGFGSQVAFVQTDEDTRFADYVTTHNGKSSVGYRPRPTRLWDGAYHSLSAETLAVVVTCDEAIACAKAYRSL